MPTSPFVCTYRTYVVGTVSKLVHTKQTLIHFCVVARTVLKSSAHNATLKTEVILSLHHDQLNFMQHVVGTKFCPCNRTLLQK